MSNDIERRTPPSSDEKEQPSREEAKAALREREEAISRHADALQREMGESGQTLLGFVREQPWLSVGGAVALGIGTSWLWGRRKRKQRAAERTHRLLTELYMDALADEVDYQVRKKGKAPQAAVYDALQDRVPLIFQEEQSQASESKGRFRKVASIVGKAAAGFAIKKGLDYLTDQVGPEDFAGGDYEGDDAAAVAAATETSS